MSDPLTSSLPALCAPSSTQCVYFTMAGTQKGALIPALTSSPAPFYLHTLSSTHTGHSEFIYFAQPGTPHSQVHLAK